MRNVILSLGCSFTDENFWSNIVPSDYPDEIKGGWPMWPELFTKMLSERDSVEYKNVNLGKSGSGMDRMFWEFAEFWSKNNSKIKAVLWGGSSWLRFSHFVNNHNLNLAMYCDKDAVNMNGRYASGYRKVTASFGVDEYMEYIIKSTKEDTVFLKQAKINLNKLLMMRDLCESNSIDFMFYNLLMPLALGKSILMGGRETPVYSADQLMLLKNADVEAWKLLTKSRKHFLGLNVYNDWVSWTQKAHTKYFGTDVEWEMRHNKEWPNEDRHPSSYGQQLIANDFYNHYDRYF